MFDKKERAELLKLARSVIETELRHTELAVSDELKSMFSKPVGIYVTLYKNGLERGTFGYTETVFPLWKSVIHAVKAAAFNDPRFPQVNITELKDILLEITIEFKPELLASPPSSYKDQFKRGDCGIMLLSSQAEQILLPKEMLEFTSDANGAIELLCERAGLPKDAWHDTSIQFYKFKVEVVKEETKNKIKKEKK